MSHLYLKMDDATKVFLKHSRITAQASERAYALFEPILQINSAELLIQPKLGSMLL